MKRNKKIILILSIIFTLVMAITLSYAFFYYGKVGDDIVLVSGGIDINYVSDSNSFQILNSFPQSDVLGEIDENYFDFTVSGTPGQDDRIKYEIQLLEEEGNTLDLRYVKVYLTDQKNNVLLKPTLLGDLPINSYNNNHIIYREYIDEISEVHQYRLRMWIDKEYTKNEENTLSFKINLYARNEKNS